MGNLRAKALQHKEIHYFAIVEVVFLGKTRVKALQYKETNYCASYFLGGRYWGNLRAKTLQYKESNYFGISEGILGQPQG